MAVTRFEVRSREPFEDGQPFGDAGPYERIDGVLHFAVDPSNPANAPIVDLDRAACDERGMVRFSADATVLRPVDPARGNRRLLQDVVNRGGRTWVAYNRVARDPARPNWIPAGDGFLLRRGWSIASVGWQWDVITGTGLVGLEAPEALDGAKSVEGWVAITHQPPAHATHLLLADRRHHPYVAADLEQPNASLTVRDYPDAPRQPIARERWRFARAAEDGVANGARPVADASYVMLEGGFEPGRIYELVFRTGRSPVAGAGLLSFRDAATFFRHSTAEDNQDNPLAGAIDHTFTIGISQSGRFLRSFLYEGMNLDEEGRQAFDGMHIHVAGARRGEFNHRYAQPSLQYPYGFGHRPPFGFDDSSDPQTGERIPGLLARQRELGGVPRIVSTNSAAEYWRGDAALLSVDTAGEHDLPEAPETRTYLFAGTQHGSGAARITDENATNERGAHALNVVHYAPLFRAALANLEAWVCDGVEPPATRVPRIADGTAVPREAVIEAFRAIPSATTPEAERLWSLPRLDLGAEAGQGVGAWPPVEGERYPTLVSAVDADGNEVGGLRLPDITVPLGTFTGWNPRHSEVGGEGQILGMSGSTLPFAPTRSERERSGDPRPSLEERYPDRAAYLEQVRAAAESLAAERYILDEDVAVCLENAEARWELLAALPVA